MTISNIGSVAAAQPNWQARKVDKPDATGASMKTGLHHHSRSGATGQPSLSESLQSLLLGTQSNQATPAAGAAQSTTAQSTTAMSALQQLQQTLTKALAAYGNA